MFLSLVEAVGNGFDHLTYLRKSDLDGNVLQIRLTFGESRISAERLGSNALRRVSLRRATLPSRKLEKDRK